MPRIGTLLVKAGRIGHEDLVEALDRQHQQRAPVTRVARKLDILSATQVLRALDHAYECATSFETAATNLGFLTATDSARLAAEVQKTGPRLGDVLVEMGVITREEVEVAIADQQREIVKVLART